MCTDFLIEFTESRLINRIVLSPVTMFCPFMSHTNACAPVTLHNVKPHLSQSTVSMRSEGKCFPIGKCAMLSLIASANWLLIAFYMLLHCQVNCAQLPQDELIINALSVWLAGDASRKTIRPWTLHQGHCRRVWRVPTIVSSSSSPSICDKQTSVDVSLVSGWNMNYWLMLSHC